MLGKRIITRVKDRNRYGLSFDWRETFREGVHKISNEYIDLFVGSYVHHNDTIVKVEKFRNVENFIDSIAWSRFLIEHERLGNEEK